VADPQTKGQLSGMLANATADAKKRIAAIAAMSSWGSTTEGAKRAVSALGGDNATLDALRKGEITSSEMQQKTRGAFAMPTTSPIGQAASGLGSMFMQASASPGLIDPNGPFAWLKKPLWGAAPIYTSPGGPAIVAGTA